LYNSFNYVRESSSIWCHTFTSVQNINRKRVGHETKMVRNLYIPDWAPHKSDAIPVARATMTRYWQKSIEGVSADVYECR